MKTLTLTLSVSLLAIALVPAHDAHACTATTADICYTESNETTVISGADTSSGAGNYGTGVAGTSVNGYGVYGSSTNSQGVEGDLTSSSADCADVLNGHCGGVVGTSASASYGGVLGVNSSSGYGGYFSSSTGRAVYGTAANADSGHFECTGTGSPAAVSGTNFGTGYGIYGHAEGTGSVGVYGSGVLYGGEFTSSGTYSAYFAQDININGTSYGPSDVRWKKNIKPVTGALEQLSKLQGVTFEWKEPEKHSGHAETQIGFIAQEVEKVFPEWVHTDPEGFKQLSVVQLEGLEVEAIRTLKQENDELKSRLDRLERGANPNRAGFTFGNGGWGIAGLAIGLGFLASRRKRDEKVV